VKHVQIITRLIVGGAQRIAIETAADCRARGDDVQIWCGPQTGPEGSLADETRARGIPLVIVPDLVKEVSPHRDAAALRWIAARLRRDRPDVVHTHSSKAGILGRRAARSARVPRIVHTIHGWGFSERTPLPARLAFVLAERVAAAWADRLVAVSDAVRAEGLRNGIGRADSYEVVRPGIDTTAFADLAAIQARGRALRDALGIPADAVLAGTVTRLSPQKDPMRIVKAARDHRNLHWLIVGDGPMRDAIEREISRDGLGDRVRLTGLRADVASCLAALDIFVLTSLWEGLPLTLLEAKMAGVPIVAARVGGVDEILPPAPAGWGFPVGDATAFDQALASCAAALPDAREAALRDRATSMEEHSLRRMLDRIHALY
jgi:glycosyltransferase involved in cell wall biosynthesis